MKIETTEELVHLQKTVRYSLTVELESGDKVVVCVDKWWVQDDMTGNYENDYNIVDQEKTKAWFTEDEWDELLEYIIDLK